MAGVRTRRSFNLVPVVMILLVSTKNQELQEKSEDESASVTAAVLPIFICSKAINFNSNFVQNFECLATADQKGWDLGTKLIKSKSSDVLCTCLFC